MKSVLTALMFFSLTAFAAPNGNVNEINRRNFLSLNTDLNEVPLTIHYPGGSPITEVCGLQLRTNIAGFANSHMEELLKEIQLLDEAGQEIASVQRVAEPPYFTLQARNTMLISYKIRTKSGISLREAIRNSAKASNTKTDDGRDPEVIVIARHCKDQS